MEEGQCGGKESTLRRDADAPFEVGDAGFLTDYK